MYFPVTMDRVNLAILLGDSTNLWESLSDGSPGTFNIISAATSLPDGFSGQIRSIAVSDGKAPGLTTGLPERGGHRRRLV